MLLPVLAGATAILLSSCANNPSTGGDLLGQYTSFDLPASLPTNQSKVRVKVSLAKQLTYVMEGDKALMVMPVSVGTSSTPTPSGNFRVQKKDHYHRANTHGYAYRGNDIRRTYLHKKPSGYSFKGTAMPYWVGFSGVDKYGFHTGWMKHAPCTHGCIRMHENLAPKFFRLVKVGTPVSIARTQPEDATIGRNVPRPIDAGPLPDYSPQFMLGNEYFTKHKTPSFQ